MTTQKRNSGMVDILSVDFQKRYESNFAAGNIGSLLRMLPGLRAAWIAGCFDDNGDITDLSEQGRTIYQIGTPEFDYAGLIPFISFDGVTDYLRRDDEPGLDITGLETYNAAAVRGLTFGGWFRLNSIAAFAMLMSKWEATAGKQYVIYFTSATNNVVCRITTDGTTNFDVTSSGTVAADTWYFVVGSFDPSTSLNIYLNGVKTTNSVAVPASIFSGPASFNIGQYDDGSSVYMNGDFSFGFISSMFLSDTIINNLFQQSRALFGV